MSSTTGPRNTLLEQAVEAVIPVLGSYSGGTVDAQPDVEGAIDRTTARFADRIVMRWQDWLKPRDSADVLDLLTDMVGLSQEDARRQAAGVLDRHLLDVRPEDRSFALDYLAGIPAQVKQVLVFDRMSQTYSLPPDWSIRSPDALGRFLPAAGELKAAWGKGGDKEPGTSRLQSKPDAPRTVLPVGSPASEQVIAAMQSLRKPEVLPKLWLLLRCHVLADRAWWKRAVLTLLLLPLFAIPALLAAFAVYWVRPWWWNSAEGILAALATGFGIFLGLIAIWLLFLWRWPSRARQALQEQARIIQETHAEEVRAWGGPAVLQLRGVVEELLRLEEKGGP